MRVAQVLALETHDHSYIAPHTKEIAYCAAIGSYPIPGVGFSRNGLSASSLSSRIQP